ncbi:MAG: hypothetical protein LBV26_02040 [Bacteroidales bacterium]|jgi:hypothetical protein|nr:hypothetical protein [Bacteroidales bacterium]
MYIRPEVKRVELDYSITLQMASFPGIENPPPRGDGRRSAPDPFSSPFDNKPFA